jgi:hypothetical protein
MPFTGHPIEKPKTPDALRVFELISLYQQARNGWEDLVSALADGYSAAWHEQDEVLKGISAQIQQDHERACCVLSLLTAGVAGGLLGGLASGVFRNMASDQTFLKTFQQGFLTNATSDGASQFGGSAVSYFQSHGSNSFASPGIDPTTYAEKMRRNVGLFFGVLHDFIAIIIRDLESGKLPPGCGEQFYQTYKALPYVDPCPSPDDITDHDFKNEAGLCLWIAWGAERNLSYWNNAWQAVTSAPRLSVPGAVTSGAAGSYAKYLIDISRWDPIIKALVAIDPQLEPQVKRSLVIGGKRQDHIDVRTLKNLGIHSKIPSAQVMSAALAAQRPLNAATARSYLETMNDLPH